MLLINYKIGNFFLPPSFDNHYRWRKIFFKVVATLCQAVQKYKYFL